MNESRRGTIEAIAGMVPAKFHRLGDRILPLIHLDMIGLVNSGLNDDDREETGTPDSYIGPSPSDCIIAVEYTAQTRGIPGQFTGDYGKVRERCPKARIIVLVAAQDIERIDFSPLRARAGTDGVELRLISGRQLAAHLDEQRQDLRADYLDIPIGQHNRDSLVAHLAKAVTAAGEGRSWVNDLANLVPRDDLDRAVMGRLAEETPSWTLVLGGMGTGKTTWAYANARRLAPAGPLVWVIAKELNYAADDPLGDVVARVAYGAAPAERIIQLGDLLQRERARLTVIMDGIDEAPDYQGLGRALRAFRTSKLYDRSHVLLVCRDEAWTTLKPVVVDAIPELDDPRKAARLRLEDLVEAAATSWLHRSGASGVEARSVVSRLPWEFAGGDRRRGGCPDTSGGSTGSVLRSIDTGYPAGASRPRQLALRRRAASG